MGTFVNATVPTDGFALGTTLSEVPVATFETVRVAAHDTNQPMPLLRMRAPDPESVDRAVHADPTTDDVRVLSRGEGQRLYRIDWQSRVRSHLRSLVDDGGTLLEAAGRDGRWEFKLFFPDHAAASQAYERCQNRDVGLVIHQVKTGTDSIAGGETVLSNEQREALVTAFRSNYYRVPRGLTQEELAEQLGLSHQALSERLRRGHQRLISTTLCNDAGQSDDPTLHTHEPRPVRR